MNKIIPAWIALLFSTSVIAAPTDISNIPMDSVSSSKPNIVFALDDSGSMDFEVTFATNEGALWWESTSKSFTDTDGKFYYNENGDFGRAGGQTWSLYGYLFPNGVATDARTRPDTWYHVLAVPPTAEFAFARSSDYNSLYYNPKVNYKPWASAYLDHKQENFSDMDPTKAESHPVFTGKNGHRVDLNKEIFSTNTNETFRMQPGMKIPGGSVSGIKKKLLFSWTDVTSDTTVTGFLAWTVAIPYYPATYYMKDSNCSSGPNCAVAPDGEKLRRFEIKEGNTFPSGRSHKAEMQNFANWYSYYRKRKLTLAASMGHTLQALNGVRGGFVRFNDLSPITMVDFDETDPAQNALSIIGEIYKNPADFTTNTRETLDYIGKQYQFDRNIITQSCQFNAAMILTDGFAVPSGPTPPSYDRAIWGTGTPFAPTYNDSLADIALAYYTRNLRPDLPAGQLPVDTTSTAPGADTNANIHMNTYALTIGPTGKIYGTNAPAALDPFNVAPSWAVPNITGSPTSIDDLWHATINGRGTMTDASSYIDIVKAMREMMYDVVRRANSSSSVTLENFNLTNQSNAVFAANHHVGYGDLKKLSIDVSNGQIDSTNVTWSAKDLLQARDPASRYLVTYDGSRAWPFYEEYLSDEMQKQLMKSASKEMTVKDLMNWVRGDTSLPDHIYRARSFILGSLVHASPVFVGTPEKQYGIDNYSTFKQANANRVGMVYQAANDGMLHAFNADTGQEEWAYLPNHSFDKLSLLASPDFIHEYTVDATPTAGDVFYDGYWHTLLIGGHGAGASGYYALDVTNPIVQNEKELTLKVLWEFPDNKTPKAVADNVGLSYGRPKLVKTDAGWVVLVTSGYNNIDGDGRGHLFVLDPKTGNVLRDIRTDEGSPDDPAGLAHISVYANKADKEPYVEVVYGGDLQGNVWRFDLKEDSIQKWTVTKLATLKDNNGNVQPITSEPELGQYEGKKIVYVGTGRLLGQNDLGSLNTYSLYGLLDSGDEKPLIQPLRSNLTSVGVPAPTGTQGWYVDLAPGEVISEMPVIANNSLVVNTNKPSAGGCGSLSHQYVLNINNDASPNEAKKPKAEAGGGGAFQNITISKEKLANSTTSAPVIAVLPSKKIVVITHNGDDTFDTIQVTVGAATVTKAVAWREVRRD